MTVAEALILTRSDVRRLASVRDYHDAVAESFRAYASGAVHAPPPMEIAGADGAFHAKGAAMTIGGRRLATLKLNGNFPQNGERFGLPTIQGAVLLCDGANGALLAIIDSIEITLRRTAAASAVAAAFLARKSAQTLLICGCGVQGRAHAEAISPLRSFKQGFVHDRDAAKARSVAAEMTAELCFPFSAAENLDDAAPICDVIVTTTTARTAFLQPHHVKAGAFIAAVGADNLAKNEIAPSLLRNAVVITDVTSQCEVIGDLRAAIAARALTRDGVRAELGEVVAGASTGRRSEDEIIVFDSTGAAFQDLAAAAMIYERALQQRAGACISLRQ